MIHGSLFSGIGGFDLAAEWMGWENAFHCEWNEFCQTILKYYWPNAKSYSDIKQTDFSIWRGRIDILTGGFPCQPFSTAGKRKGTGDDRYLWPEMLRAIREIQPKWIVGENVLGIVNWDGGLVFEQVCSDLEAEGYEVQPYVLPSAGVNAPHRRDRVWFVAFNAEFAANGGHNAGASSGIGVEMVRDIMGSSGWEQSTNDTEPSGNDGTVTYTNCQQRCKGRLHQEESEEAERYPCASGACASRASWQNFPTQSPVRFGNDGISTYLDAITFSKWRNESIKAGGNAIVPQVALQIFKAIEQYNSLTQAIE